MENDCGLDEAISSLPLQGRFVLLRHEIESNQQGDSHWDLMLEAGDSLLTWRLNALPKSASIRKMQSLLAKRIADHRPVYLDYEGEISGNRGSVRQVLKGTYVQLSEIDTGSDGEETPAWNAGWSTVLRVGKQIGLLHIPFSKFEEQVSIQVETWEFQSP